MRKIFLDVGGFEGESSQAALDPLFGFERVYCFEPVASCCERIRKVICDRRFELVSVGLLDRTTTLPVRFPGSPAASLYSDTVEAGRADDIGCAFMKASDFFQDNIMPDDRVWMKLNCEGAEIAILNDLLDSGEATKLEEVLIDLDAVKLPSMRTSAERIVDRLTSAPFSFHYPPEIQYGMVNNFGGIRNWLLSTGAAEHGTLKRVSSLLYQFPYVCDRRFNGYYKIRLLRLLRMRPPAEHIPRELRSTWSPIDQPRGPYYQP